MLLLALGNHHHRNLWVACLYLAEGIKPANAWHIFIKKHKVNLVGVCIQFIESFAAAHHGDNIIPLLFQKQNVWFQKVDFVIGPQDGDIVHNTIVCYNLIIPITRKPQKYCLDN